MVTSKDVARVAGVSQSTVSRVLNDAPTRVPIAADTRERVMVAARNLGYRPNPHARSLRGASTMLIGAVVRDFSDPFFATVIEALAVQAMARGYNIVLGHAHGRVDEGIALTSVLETRHTDAIVTRDQQAAGTFTAQVDSSAVLVNASTRFNDGGQLGLGAEIGISTDKYHARGPCGLRELTSTKWIVYGDGQIRG